jgi:hypothetical protein
LPAAGKRTCEHRRDFFLLQNLSQQTGLHSAEAAEGYIRSAKAYSRAGEEIRMAVTGKIDFAHQNIPWK